MAEEEEDENNCKDQLFLFAGLGGGARARSILG
jgi:hypothetical protein